jgi:hypothetical protein
MHADFFTFFCENLRDLRGTKKESKPERQGWFNRVVLPADGT